MKVRQGLRLSHVDISMAWAQMECAGDVTSGVALGGGSHWKVSDVVMLAEGIGVASFSSFLGPCLALTSTV